MAILRPIKETDELRPGKRYKQVYELTVPSWLQWDALIETMSKTLVEARNRDQRFEVENWNMSKVGDKYTLTITFKVVGSKGSVAQTAGPAAALTPIVVKGLLVLAAGVLGIVGLSFILKITYAVVELVDVLPYIAFPVGLYFLWRMMQEEQKRGSG